MEIKEKLEKASIVHNEIKSFLSPHFLKTNNIYEIANFIENEISNKLEREGKKIFKFKSKSVFVGSGIGFLSSILGIGGGTFSVPYFKGSGLNLTSAIGTSAACGVPIAIFGTLGYIFAGIDSPLMPNFSLGYVYVPAVLGVSITSIFAARYGAELAHYLSQEVLRMLMAGWFFVVSIYMFVI